MTRVRISLKWWNKTKKWLSNNPEKPLLFSLSLIVLIIGYYFIKGIFSIFNNIPSVLVNITSTNLTNNVTNQTIETTINDIAPVSTNILGVMALFFGLFVTFKAIGIVRSSLRDSGL